MITIYGTALGLYIPMQMIILFVITYLLATVLKVDCRIKKVTKQIDILCECCKRLNLTPGFFILYVIVEHQFGIPSVFRINGRLISKWQPVDELVNKFAAEYLYLTAGELLSPNCLHLRGHGGMPRAAKIADYGARHYKYVYKTDVKSYYRSIDQSILLRILQNHYGARHFIVRLCRRHLTKVAEVTTGISSGSALSPMLSGIYLNSLDRNFRPGQLEGEGAVAWQDAVLYCRYNDDILLFANSPERLRSARAESLAALSALRLAKRSNKTQVGGAAHGFDFCGFTYGVGGLTGLAPATDRGCRTRFLRKRGFLRRTTYVRRFLAWVKGIAPDLVVSDALFGKVRRVALGCPGVRCPDLIGLSQGYTSWCNLFVCCCQLELIAARAWLSCGVFWPTPD